MFGDAYLTPAMNITETTAGRKPLHAYAKVALVALVFAVLITTGGWFLAAKGSPINHGVAPDVHDRPDMACWVFINFPAAILFISFFGKLGSEASYFLCIFLQWLLVGAGVGTVVASVRRAKV